MERPLHLESNWLHSSFSPVTWIFVVFFDGESERFPIG